MVYNDAVVIPADSELVYTSQAHGERGAPEISISSDGQVSIGLFVWAISKSLLQAVASQGRVSIADILLLAVAR